jgi:hypothetical protein
MGIAVVRRSHVVSYKPQADILTTEDTELHRGTPQSNESNSGFCAVKIFGGMKEMLGKSL